MKVLKFGGTSVGTVESLNNVKRIVEAIDEPIVVVVSALGGLTDKLIATAKKGASGDGSFREDMTAIRERHHNIIGAVIGEDRRQECLDKVNSLLDELARLYEGVYLIGDLPSKTLDSIVSFGERMSSIIVSLMLPQSAHADSLGIIKTEKYHGKDIADTKLTEANIKKQISPEEGRPVIMGGFISCDKDSGEITNLGRGGSDYTAALVAAALDADELQIWTDVDGFMTSDPRIISDANIIDKMSFVESMELCTFGAKVIYPPTIYPVFHKNIPIRILNTFNPSAPGTLIKDYSSHDLAHQSKIRGLSSLKDISIIHIKGSLTRNIAAISSRTFNALANNGLTVFLVTPVDEADSFSFALRNAEMEKALELVEKEYAPEISCGLISGIESVTGLSLVAVVGEEILSGGYISPRIINTLERSSISPVAISEGASKTTVTLAVPDEHTVATLRLIHDLFF